MQARLIDCISCQGVLDPLVNHAAYLKPSEQSEQCAFTLEKLILMRTQKTIWQPSALQMIMSNFTNLS